MSSTKIKKHFSLFMVQKSIKKPSKKHPAPESNEQFEQVEKWVPKFIDPLTTFHLYGDIVFIDKLNESNVGLISPIQQIKSPMNLQFNKKFNNWTIDMVSTSDHIDSWGMLYDRLMSLGDNSAYELAQTIQQIFLQEADLKQTETDAIGPKENFFMEVANEIKNSEKVMQNKEIMQEEEKIRTQTELKKIEKAKSIFQDFLRQVEDVLISKNELLYFFVVYEQNSIAKGLELKKQGFSQKLVDLVWDDEKKFVDIRCDLLNK